jgi:hypothetical protein
LADGTRSIAEIAALTGVSKTTVQRIVLAEDLPRLPAHSPSGKRNPSWKGGYLVSHDGYLYVSAYGHPSICSNKKIRAHRFLMEMAIGRFLESGEIVDHVNGLSLDNRMENLRLFESNAEHLRHTLKGRVPRWSEAGLANMRAPRRQAAALGRISSAHQARKRGETREQSLLLFRERYDIEPIDLLRSEVRRLLGPDVRHWKGIELAFLG